jgi:hypothetical protein
VYAPFLVVLPFLNASRKYSVTAFSISCDSVYITSTVSKWQPFSFIFNQGNRKKLLVAKSGKYGGWGMTVTLFLVKIN